MVDVSNSAKARMNIFGMDFSSKFSELITLRNPMLFLTVFPGKSFKLSPYLNKAFPNFSQANSVKLSKDLTIASYSTRVLPLAAKDKEKHLF